MIRHDAAGQRNVFVRHHHDEVGFGQVRLVHSKPISHNVLMTASYPNSVVQLARTFAIKPTPKSNLYPSAPQRFARGSAASRDIRIAARFAWSGIEVRSTVSPGAWSPVE